MTTELLGKDSPTSTAKILQFPARGRYVEHAKTETVSEAAFDSWYHDVAIKESKRTYDR
jgi:hypothetical protein